MSTLSPFHSDAAARKRMHLAKKQGVSGESGGGDEFENLLVEKHPKDFKSKQLIKDAIMENDFLKNLDSSQVQEIVDCMYSQHFYQGTLVIREGDVGSHLYVTAEGELEVKKNGKAIGKLRPGKAFGELAILYNCTRTASVQAMNDAKLWVLERKAFQVIMMKSGLQRQQENINFLRSVPLLQNLNHEILAKLADVLEIDFYETGEYIIREGAVGDTFFIISKGKVTVTKKTSNAEEEIRVLERGDYFGERALLTEDRRTANVIASAPGVECLALDRDSFKQFIGDLRELQDKSYDDGIPKVIPLSSIDNEDVVEEYAHITLADLEVVGTLGVGGFGRVELISISSDGNIVFLMQSSLNNDGKLRKFSVFCNSPERDKWIPEVLIRISVKLVEWLPGTVHEPRETDWKQTVDRLYKTFRNQKYVYMLMEACLGGEIWSCLRDRVCFDEQTTRFYTACVIDALEYLHSKNIIYRDLKPENLMLDNRGYLKLVDFGFSTRLTSGRKTWTFCGTPEYVAPEIILNKGHDRAVDYWATGVLMFELLTGAPPFTAQDPMKIYNIILKGIDMIVFPNTISKNAQHLIKRLCKENPSERLGYQKGGVADIKKHKWFQGFHWQGLKEQALQPQPPIVPKVSGPTDTSNFDTYPRDFDVPLDEDSGWDTAF